MHIVVERTTDTPIVRPGVRACDGFTLLEVLFVSSVIAILAASAIPSLLRSRAAANETSAVGSLRMVHTAQLGYAISCGLGMYASSFPDFDLPGGEGFLAPELTAGVSPVKSGYTYTLQPGPGGPAGLIGCNGAPLALDYYVAAVPIVLSNTGSRAFASNPTHVIWQDTTGVAPTEPFAEGATISPIR